MPFDIVLIERRNWAANFQMRMQARMVGGEEGCESAFIVEPFAQIPVLKTSSVSPGENFLCIILPHQNRAGSCSSTLLTSDAL
jgi:hypothetical protein